jgi:hypothetical protein
MPAPSPLPMRERREVMKTAARTGMQQQKYLRLPMVWLKLVSLLRFVRGERLREVDEGRRRKGGRGLITGG